MNQTKRVSSKRRKPRANIGGRDGATWNSVAESVPQFPVPKGNKEVSVVQNVDLGTVLTASISVTVAASINFKASDLDNIASWTSVFDQYKIEEVELWIHPETGSSAVNTALYSSVLDYDDSTNLASFAAAQDYDSCVTTSELCGHYRRLKPHIAVAAYAGAFTSYKNEDAGWIDCASTAVQHYGVKLFSNISNQATVFRGIARYHMRFRNVR